MASRQRSFFDPTPKTRPHHGYGRRPSNAPNGTNVPLQKPDVTPIAASTQSKVKLKAFQFLEHGQTDMETQARAGENKENAVPEDQTERDDPAARMMHPPPCHSSQRSTTKEPRDCPQTPVGRLPLSQLLANADDGNCSQNMTPVERVLWDNSPLESMMKQSHLPLKKRKRAQSSSPISSQNRSVKKLSTVDVQALQEALKTPKADIIDDLWSRYSHHTHGMESTTPDKPPLHHTFHSSSPQTPAPQVLGRDSGGLRRAFSCIDWPTSTAKRRKLRLDRGLEVASTRAPNLERVESPVENAKMSRVSFLVEKLHHNLARPAGEQSTLSGRKVLSPTVKTSDAKRQSSSERQEDGTELDHVVHVLSQTAVVDDLKVLQLPAETKTDAKMLQLEDGSSDFGDEDIDINLVEALTGHKDREYTTECPSDTHGASRNPYKTIPAISHSAQEISRPTKDDHDEFDDDEHDSMTAADLEHVFARYETQSMPHSAPNPQDRLTARSTDPDSGVALSVGKPGPRLKAVSLTNARKAEVLILSDDEDEFEVDSDLEQAVIDCVGTSERSVDESTSKTSPHTRKPSILHRHLVKNIFEGGYTDESGRQQPEKVLYVQNEKTKQAKVIILRQSWVDSPCLPGSLVQLVGDFDKYGQCIVDNSRNLLILHPDHLISSTVVGDSFTCVRKAVLEDRVKATSDANQSTVYGHMLHEIFQESLRANRWDEVWISSLVDRVVSRHIEDLFEIGLDHDMAAMQLKSRAVELCAWAEIFVAPKPKPNAIVKDRNGAQSLICVNKLLEVEEKVWSPRYGLKGNIDATVQITVDGSQASKTLTVPFELKTGKHASAAHKAQTSLYTLLLSDRYDIDIACGILYYMQSSEVSNVKIVRHELLPMILQRNLLASYVRNRNQLPPMLKNAFTCNKCFAKTTCFLYHKLMDNGTGDTSGVGEKFDQLTKHLKAEHQKFFSKWDNLLTKEEKDMIKFRRELWTMSSLERERAGRCFADVVIEPGSFREETDAPKINRFTYTFMKRAPQDANFSFLESQIIAGEPIVISDEIGHFALANGFVKNVRKNKIQIIIDRRLHGTRTKEKDFNPLDNQVFAGIMTVKEDSLNLSASSSPKPEEPMVYRLDKDEFSNGMALVRNNLVKLMERDEFGVQALRRLIIDGVAPTFNQSPQLSQVAASMQTALNVDQRAAIEKVMGAKDYALVLGMPGTGKTTTIAHIIRTLVSQDKSVLLTSYTHTAVDNILLKLRKDKIGIFRLGSLAKIHPEVQEFADLAGKPLKTEEDLKRSYSRKVVATTCLGINHPIFSQQIFDYCIVDEASQITLPVCLGPIRMARTFILVGDHYQLPPLVQNKDALDGGLDISLFKMLSDSHPECVVNLEHQYRMCKDIMTLSNTLIYKGMLKCGTQTVAEQSIAIPDIHALKKHHHVASGLSSLTTTISRICTGPTPGACWLRDLLDPLAKAVFVNTDSLGPMSREVLENGTRITNPAEAALTAQLVESLLTTGISPSEIGVITLYRSQLASIKRSLRHRPGIEMHTADRFQGRDKEAVVLSLVRSNELQVVGELLKDWRRVNVALTRARTKLLILGSKSTLRGNELLKDLIALMESNGWCYDLPRGCLEDHLFEEVATQVSSVKMLSGAFDGDVEDKKNSTTNEDAKANTAAGEKQKKTGAHPTKVKRPMKQAHLDIKSLIGKRPVLRDIINDCA